MEVEEEKVVEFSEEGKNDNMVAFGGIHPDL